jgi:hypothetical protein
MVPIQVQVSRLVPAFAHVAPGIGGCSGGYGFSVPPLENGARREGERRATSDRPMGRRELGSQAAQLAGQMCLISRHNAAIEGCRNAWQDGQPGEPGASKMCIDIGE